MDYAFFDKVKDVTEDDMKIIWGKILAGARFSFPEVINLLDSVGIKITEENFDLE
ncbi:hypothetical protein AALC25_00870 [Lachnospiraceae bacterium 29-84]